MPDKITICYSIQLIMKNISLIFLCFLILMSIEGFSQGNGKDKDNGNGPKPEHNVFPPYGSVGIGTRYPSETLEVIGNVKVSETMQANQLNVIGLQATRLSVAEDVNIGSNLLVSGSVGIGVTSPTEKLDIAGNLRVSSTIFSEQINTTGVNSTIGNFSGRLTIGENALVSGLVGIGVAEPEERLEVAGNIKATENLLANGFQVINGNISSTLRVSENAFVDGFVGVGTSSPAEKLEVAGNIKANGNLMGVGIRAEDGVITKSMNIGENLVVNGNLGIGVADPEEKLDIAGNLKISGFADANQISATGMTTATLQVNETMTVNDLALFNGKIGIGVNNPTEALQVNGNIKATGNLTANAVNTESLNTNDAQVDGNLNVTGNIKAGIIEATEIRTPNQQSGQLSISKLSVNSTRNIPDGYVMAVDGKMLATRVEVFAPENWPDYVFEKDYHLRPLEEVESYVQKHGHLPEVPSAKAMQQGGYSVATMDASLLEKIEELTLYMIELKKENQGLKNRIQQLEELNK